MLVVRQDNPGTATLDLNGRDSSLAGGSTPRRLSVTRAMDLHTPDSYASAREQMVRLQLCARNITDQRVLTLMGQVPRDRFVPQEQLDRAYDDCALPIGSGQTISQPYMVALMTQQLDIGLECNVLEIGTGSGYQTAILAQLARRVHTVERIAGLAEAAAVRLSELGIHNVTFHVADGSTGWAEDGPYDRILVTAGAPAVPEALTTQLVDGGRLVVPVGGVGEQVLTIVDRRGDRTTEIRSILCRFVKLIGSAGWKADPEDSFNA